MDTSLFIDYLRGRRPVREFFDIIKGDEIFYSAVTEAELFSGKSCEGAKARAAVEKLLSIGTKVPVTNPVAALAGEYRRKHAVPLDDAFIAATATITGARLFSMNSEHFRRIPGLDFKIPY